MMSTSARALTPDLFVLMRDSSDSDSLLQLPAPVWVGEWEGQWVALEGSARCRK